MIKYSNVAPIIHHKIARNKTMYEIYELSQEIIDIQIEIKNQHKLFYEENKKTLLLINDIEELQTQEYTEQRQESITSLMGLICSKPDDTYLNEKIIKINESIKEKTIIIDKYQKLIPNKGIATNYKIKDPSNTTCSREVQIY